MNAGVSRGAYYGWRVVAALFVVGMMVYGGGLYAFTVFIPALTTEFGLNRATTGGLVSIFWLTAPTGRHADEMPSAKRPFPYAASGTIALGPIGRQFPNGFSSPFSRRLAELALESTGERRRRSETRAFGNEFDRPIAVGE